MYTLPPFALSKKHSFFNVLQISSSQAIEHSKFRQPKSYLAVGNHSKQAEGFFSFHNVLLPASL